MTKKKKTLLEEGTVRQFMKLANLKPLTSGFVDKLYEGEEVQEENAELEERQKSGGNKDDREKDAPEDEHEDKDTEEEEDKADYEKPTSKKGKKRKKKAEAERKDEGQQLFVNEDDAADDDWGGNEGDESETDPGHIDYEGEPIDDDDGGDLDVHSLVRAIASAIESETGVSVDVAEEEEEADVEDVEGEDELEDTAALDDEEVDLGDEPELDDLEEVVSTIAENVTKRLQRMAAKSKKKGA